MSSYSEAYFLCLPHKENGRHYWMMFQVLEVAKYYNLTIQQAAYAKHHSIIDYQLYKRPLNLGPYVEAARKAHLDRPGHNIER